MSQEAGVEHTVLGLRLRVWLTTVIAFVIGVVLGLAWFGSGALRISVIWGGTEIVAVATLIGVLGTAGATTVLALKTATLAAATKDMAEATRTEAAAAKETVEEIKKDRELTFRPYVSWELGAGIYVIAVNFGRGPALNTIFCAVEEDEQAWRSTAPLLQDISPNQKTSSADQITLAPKTGPIPPRPNVGSTMPRKVAFCEDQLGNRYRFLPGAIIADMWRPGEKKPAWVTWYEGNAPIAVRS